MINKVLIALLILGITISCGAANKLTSTKNHCHLMWRLINIQRPGIEK